MLSGKKKETSRNYRSGDLLKSEGYEDHELAGGGKREWGRQKLTLAANLCQWMSSEKDKNRIMEPMPPTLLKTKRHRVREIERQQT